MLTIESIRQRIEPYGIPVAYLYFQKKQIPPYCIIRLDDTNNLLSDLHFHRQIDTFSLELYYRDPADRVSFEKYLTGQDFLWQRVSTDTAIGNDGVYLSIYELDSN